MLKKSELKELVNKNLDKGFDIWVASAKREHNAISYYEGKIPCLMIPGAWHNTLDELKDEYRKTMTKDIQSGYDQRRVGYYDKWYRYCRFDGGFAYDIGCRFVCDKGDVKTDEFHLIECNQY